MKTDKCVNSLSAAVERTKTITPQSEKKCNLNVNYITILYTRNYSPIAPTTINNNKKVIGHTFVLGTRTNETTD